MKKESPSSRKKPWEIDGTSTSDVTPEHRFHERRAFMKNSLVASVATALPAFVHAAAAKVLPATKGAGATTQNTTPPNGAAYPAKQNEKYKTLLAGDDITKEDIATSYNNFYEFSLDKGGVKPKTAGWKLTDNWNVEVGGLVENKKSYSVRELIELAGGLEERIYRFRCVEAWSMVVPWTGFSLASLLTKLKPKAGAKYVRFETFNDRKIGVGMGDVPQYPWPYTEGLTLAEAMHPLTLMATGMYGKPLPKQNGAPIRLIVPWKYGFKSIKSIVKIDFVTEEPKTLWNQLAPSEYGFYANVNPEVDHPRWSQASERVLDSSFFPKRKPTLMFNGYASEVASLYKGLDLKKNY